MKISGDALELALRVVLSCPCPVTPEQERRVYELARGLPPQELADYASVLAVFGAADTPFHRLADFTRWVAPVDAEPVIERHHVLRANASSYHWEHAAAALSGAVDRVTSLSGWLPAHLILPVRLGADDAGDPYAVYEYQGGAIVLRHVFLPAEFDAAAHSLWAIHFAAVLGPLEPGEHELLVVLLEANRQLAVHRRQVAAIDYRDFELQGDYAEFCRRRHAAYWGPPPD